MHSFRLMLVIACFAGSCGVCVWALTADISSLRAGHDPADAPSQRRLEPVRALGALGAAATTWAMTGWPVAALCAGGLVIFWRSLTGGASHERQEAERAEALAVWTESLRDVIAGAANLEHAIAGSARNAPVAIAPQVAALSSRLEMHVSIKVALRRFAEEIGDLHGDLVASALTLNAGLRGPGLRQVMTALSLAIRSEVDARRRIASSRAAMRRSVHIILVVAGLMMLGQSVFNPSYVAAFDTLLGQVVLAGSLAFLLGGLLWIRRLSRFESSTRLFHETADSGGER